MPLQSVPLKLDSLRATKYARVRGSIDLHGQLLVPHILPLKLEQPYGRLKANASQPAARCSEMCNSYGEKKETIFKNASIGDNHYYLTTGPREKKTQTFNKRNSLIKLNWSHVCIVRKKSTAECGEIFHESESIFGSFGRPPGVWRSSVVRQWARKISSPSTMGPMGRKKSALECTGKYHYMSCDKISTSSLLRDSAFCRKTTAKFSRSRQDIDQFRLVYCMRVYK